jgi:hypothetical protein
MTTATTMTTATATATTKTQKQKQRQTEKNKVAGQDKVRDNTRQHKATQNKKVANLCFCLSDLSFGLNLGFDLATVLAFLKLGRLLGL